MNPIYDCPLSMGVDDIVSILEWCDTPALIIGMDKRLITYNNKIEKSAKATEILTLIQMMCSQSFHFLDTMQVGELICVQGGMGSSVCLQVARFECFYYVSVNEGKPSKLQNKPQVEDVIPSRHYDVGAEEGLSLNTDTETRRRQERDVQDQSDFTMRYISVDRIVEEEERSDDLLFDPGEAAAFVCNIAKNELPCYSAELFTNIVLSDRLSDMNQEQYCVAVAALLMIAEKHTDNGVVKVEGQKDGEKYKLSVVFGWGEGYKRLAEMGSMDYKDWYKLFGSEAKALTEYKRDLGWQFELNEHRGGTLCLSLSIPLTAKESFSFLRTYIKKTTYRSVFNRFVIPTEQKC